MNSNSFVLCGSCVVHEKDKHLALDFCRLKHGNVDVCIAPPVLTVISQMSSLLVQLVLQFERILLLRMNAL